MKPDYQVAVVGGGPAGSTCAALCAEAGLRVVLIERSRFPREKVCGDCLNPLAWPVLDRLGMSEAVRRAPHSRLKAVEFVGTDGVRTEIPLADHDHGEIAIKRSILDELLLRRAATSGVTIFEETALLDVAPSNAGWGLRTSNQTFTAELLVAADGRNSSVARALGILPAAVKDRVGLQTHIPLPGDLRDRVRMQFVPEGYTGIADIGDDLANLCLVARPRDIDQLKRWAEATYGLGSEQGWRTITPLRRAPVDPVHEGLLLVGDAARVVEPFTGEGIAYALLTGEAAAHAIIQGNLAGYRKAHSELYRGRLWINELARLACLYPRAATHVIRFARHVPAVLGMLTRKVVMPSRPTKPVPAIR